VCILATFDLVWSGSSFNGNAEPLYVFFTQFPRQSAMRFSRENRFTLFLELRTSSSRWQAAWLRFSVAQLTKHSWQHPAREHLARRLSRQPQGNGRCGLQPSGDEHRTGHCGGLMGSSRTDNLPAY